jgi:hypothetical protein
MGALQLFLDFSGGGAWPFLVGGVICLLNCDNERDLDLLTHEVAAFDVEGDDCWVGGRGLSGLRRIGLSSLISSRAVSV